jgi:hypothetical protein
MAGEISADLKHEGILALFGSVTMSTVSHPLQNPRCHCDVSDCGIGYGGKKSANTSSAAMPAPLSP